MYNKTSTNETLIGAVALVELGKKAAHGRFLHQIKVGMLGILLEL